MKKRVAKYARYLGGRARAFKPRKNTILFLLCLWLLLIGLSRNSILSYFCEDSFFASPAGVLGRAFFLNDAAIGEMYAQTVDATGVPRLYGGHWRAYPSRHGLSLPRR